MSEDPRDYIRGAKRCALKKSDCFDDWYVGTSPRNGDYATVEGSWADWVELAQNILKADAEYMKQCIKPNAETIQALEDARAGRLEVINTIKELFGDDND